MEQNKLKPWLTLKQQIAHLQSEGIEFFLVNEADAERYLRNNNNFFRINSFKKGFERREGGPNEGKYVNLNFGMLQDFAIIDYEFRQVLLPIAIRDGVACSMLLAIQKLFGSFKGDAFERGCCPFLMWLSRCQ